MCYLPLFHEFTRGASLLDTAVHIVPLIGVFITATIIASNALPLVSCEAALFVLAGIPLLASGLLVTIITAATPDCIILGCQTLWTVDIGLIFTNAVSMVNASLDDPAEWIAAATLFNMASSGGICLALPVASSIYQNRGLDLLSDRLADFQLDSRGGCLLAQWPANDVGKNGLEKYDGSKIDNREVLRNYQ